MVAQGLNVLQGDHGMSEERKKAKQPRGRKYIGWIATVLSAVAVVATLTVGFRMMLGTPSPDAGDEAMLEDQAVMSAAEIASSLTRQIAAQPSAMPSVRPLASIALAEKPAILLTTTPQPTATPYQPQATNLSFEVIDAFTLRLKWRGSSGGIFSIYEITSANGARHENYLSVTSDNHYDYPNPIPGVEYAFEVRGNNIAAGTFTVPEAKAFDKYAFRIDSGKSSGGKLFLVGEAYYRDNQTHLATLREAARDEILKNIVQSNDYVYEYFVLWNSTPDDKNIREMRVLTSPSGGHYSRVADMTVDGSWDGLDGYRGFKSLLEACYEQEGLPSGTYLITLYWDGMLMDSEEFVVK